MFSGRNCVQAKWCQPVQPLLLVCSRDSSGTVPFYVLAAITISLSCQCCLWGSCAEKEGQLPFAEQMQSPGTIMHTIMCNRMCKSAAIGCFCCLFPTVPLFWPLTLEWRLSGSDLRFLIKTNRRMDVSDFTSRVTSPCMHFVPCTGCALHDAVCVMSCPGELALSRDHKHHLYPLLVSLQYYKDGWPSPILRCSPLRTFLQASSTE